MNIQDIKKVIDLGFDVSFEVEVSCFSPENSMSYNVTCVYFDLNKRAHVSFLRTARGDVRVFKTFETVYKFISRFGVDDFKVVVSPSEVLAIKENNSQLEI